MDIRFFYKLHGEVFTVGEIVSSLGLANLGILSFVMKYFLGYYKF